MIRSKLNKAHKSFKQLLQAANLTEAERHWLTGVWDELIKAADANDKRRLNKSIDRLSRTIEKITRSK